MKRLRSNTATGLVLLRTDSAYYAHSVVAAAHRGGAKVSITARMDPAVKRAIGSIADTAWTTIQYTNAILDEGTGKWVSVAEVAEVTFTAFISKKKADRIEGRLVVRRIPELNAFAGDGQPTLFDIHRFHAFFTTSDLDTVTADKTHRQHAQIEQINADLKDSALGHFPSGVITANAAWLVLAVTAFTLSRARDPDEHRPRQSENGDDPPQTHPDSRTDLDLGTESDAAPPRALVLANGMDESVRGGLRPATNRFPLTIQPADAKNCGTSPAARPDPSSSAPATASDRNRADPLSEPDRWIQA